MWIFRSRYQYCSEALGTGNFWNDVCLFDHCRKPSNHATSSLRIVRVCGNISWSSTVCFQRHVESFLGTQFALWQGYVRVFSISSTFTTTKSSIISAFSLLPKIYQSTKLFIESHGLCNIHENCIGTTWRSCSFICDPKQAILRLTDTLVSSCVPIIY